MIVFIEQAGGAVAFFLRVKRTRGKILDVNLSRIDRPKRGRDITFVVEPRSYPKQIAARHKLTRHLRVRRCKRLKHMKQPAIANGPRYEYETESQRKDRGVKRRVTKLPKASQRRQHERESDGGGKETAVRTEEDCDAGEQASHSPPRDRSFSCCRFERESCRERHRHGEKVCCHFREDCRDVDRCERTDHSEHERDHCCTMFALFLNRPLKSKERDQDARCGVEHSLRDADGRVVAVTEGCINRGEEQRISGKTNQRRRVRRLALDRIDLLFEDVAGDL